MGKCDFLPLENRASRRHSGDHWLKDNISLLISGGKSCKIKIQLPAIISQGFKMIPLREWNWNFLFPCWTFVLNLEAKKTSYWWIKALAVDSSYWAPIREDGRGIWIQADSTFTGWWLYIDTHRGYIKVTCIILILYLFIFIFLFNPYNFVWGNIVRSVCL